MADLFKTAMLAAYDESVQAQVERPRFLQGFFGKTPREIVRSDTEKVEVDVLRGVRGLAVDVARASGIARLNHTGLYTSKDFVVPLYNEYTNITAAMLNKRVPGVDPYSPTDKMFALAYWCGKAQAELSLKIYRAIELQAAQALLTGIVLLANGLNLDWGKVAAHSIIPAIKWDVALGSNPIADLETACDLARADGMMAPDTVIMGATAFDVFIANAAVIAYMNGRYIEPGRLAPGSLIEGARPWGRLGIGPYMLDFYIYNDSYADPATGVDTPYVTTDSVIVFNRNAFLQKAFAAVEMLPQMPGLYSSLGMPPVPQAEQGDIVPYVAPDWPSNLRAGVQSAPVCCPTAIDTIVTIDQVDT